MKAKELTKDYLLSEGIEIKFDENETPHVYIDGKERKLGNNRSSKSKKNKKFNYLFIPIYAKDTEGKYIKIKAKDTWKCSKKHYVYKLSTILLGRAIWAWTYDVCPGNMVVDHIENDCDRSDPHSYRISNLQVVTNKYNCRKDKVRKVVRKKDYNFKELLKEINKLEILYEDSKDILSEKELKKIRAKISYRRAVLRGKGYEFI